MRSLREKEEASTRIRLLTERERCREMRWGVRGRANIITASIFSKLWEIEGDTTTAFECGGEFSDAFNRSLICQWSARTTPCGRWDLPTHVMSANKYLISPWWSSLCEGMGGEVEWSPASLPNEPTLISEHFQHRTWLVVKQCQLPSIQDMLKLNTFVIFGASFVVYLLSISFSLLFICFHSLFLPSSVCNISRHSFSSFPPSPNSFIIILPVITNYPTWKSWCYRCNRIIYKLINSK